MAKSIVAKHSVIGAAALIGLTGCSSISNLVEPNKIDYKSASKATTVSLEVPPDLTQIRRDSRFAVPDANKSTATASGYNLEKSGQKASSATSRLRHCS
jgi:outer membrane protein assembly factor BamC